MLRVSSTVHEAARHAPRVHLNKVPKRWKHRYIQHYTLRASRCVDALLNALPVVIVSVD
jgi:hypothetical protein